MMSNYFISDIHGDFNALSKALSYIEKEKKDFNLYFLGDYLDRGKDGIKVALKIMELCKKEPHKYFALPGNHDKMFLDFLRKGDSLWLHNDYKFYSLTSLLEGTDFEDKQIFFQYGMLMNQGYELITKDIRAAILLKHKELVEWYESLPYHIELENQILVHAGVDFSLDDWRETSDEDKIWLYPPRRVKNNTGKQLIVGHVQAAEFRKEGDGYGIYYLEGSDTYYIDGSTPATGSVNILEWNDKEGYVFHDQV